MYFVKRCWQTEPSLVKTISDLRHFEWSHDLVVLLIATRSDTNELAELLKILDRRLSAAIVCS